MFNKVLLSTLLGLWAGAAHALTYPNHWPQVAKTDQAWVPSLRYPGRINDTEKLKAWVLQNTR